MLSIALAALGPSRRAIRGTVLWRKNAVGSSQVAPHAKGLTASWATAAKDPERCAPRHHELRLILLARHIADMRDIRDSCRPAALPHRRRLQPCPAVFSSM